MKVQNVERLEKMKIIDSAWKIFLPFIPALAWIIMVMFYGQIVGDDTDRTICVVLYLIILPLIFGIDQLKYGLRLMPGFRGSIGFVIGALIVCFALVLAAVFLCGVLLLVYYGVIRFLISAVSMIVYNVRISRINKLSGNMTPYVNDEKFLAKLDNIYETVDVFAEYRWISKKKFDKFIEQYSLIMGFVNCQEEYSKASAVEIG